MSLRDCIRDAVAAGEMDRERARQALDLFDEIEAEHRANMSPEEAARRAAEDTALALRREASEKRRRTLLTIRATQRLHFQLRSYRDRHGKHDMPAALMALLDRDDMATYSNVEARRKRILGSFHKRMTDVLATFRRDLFGRTRQKALMRDMVREIFGEETGSAAAREMAQAWAEAAEFARLRFNAAGGRIPKRQDWGLPQIHDPLAVRKASYEEWRDFTLPRLDPSRMIDEATGRPFTAERIEIVMRDVWETIRTDGFSKRTPSGVPRGRMVASRHTDHRFLVFNSADNWMAYQSRFGATDPFSTMMGHLDQMAREIGMMEVLGPNPHGQLRYLAEVVEKDAADLDAAAGGERNMDRARRAIKASHDMFFLITGATNAPVNGRIGRSLAGLRAFLQSTQLGAAALSAITDIGFQRIAAKHAGIPQARVIARALKLMTPTVTEDQKLAVRLGLIAEGWSSHAIALARYVGDVQGGEISRRLADFTLRVSGLSPWTQAGRWAFGMEFMGHLADLTARGFDKLPEATRSTLRRYGIGAADWDVIRATELYTERGGSFLRPDDIAERADIAPERADHLATRIMEMIQSETEFAVPSSSLRGRAALISDARPGTFVGEVIRSAAMYKSFAITLAMTHVRRAMMQTTLARKGQYAADLMITTTLLGALALQMKEIAKGRDPRDMFGDDAAKFWGAAMIQGGGMGIFGDFLFSDVNRFDRGLGETIAGPVFGFAQDLRRLALGNIMQLATDDNTNAGREAVNFLRRYTPAGSVWYARLAYERIMLDRLQALTDPRATRSWRANRQRWQRETGQQYWWRPGAGAPARPPDFEAALEG